MPRLTDIPRRLARRMRSRGAGQALRLQREYLLRELQRMQSERRWDLLRSPRPAGAEALQTRESFDWQWTEFDSGVGLADDPDFMAGLEDDLLAMTGLGRREVRGLRVVDAGCGAGRWTLGFLRLGARVLACDQSRGALDRVQALCSDFKDRLELRQADLLAWDEVADFDLAFSFGVVHHTGNTYLAIRNVARKVRPGGRLFLMVYGHPRTPEELEEVLAYERLREELAGLDFEARRRRLVERFGPHLAHGWFDAVSPRVNDLLTFEELAELLDFLGFKDVRRTRDNRNHHLVGRRAAASTQ